MSAFVAFLIFAFLAAACFVAGVYVVAGSGFALIAAGICSSVTAAFIRRGIIIG